MMQKRKFNLYILYVFLTYLVLMGYFCILRGGGIPWVNLIQVALAIIMLANYYVVANIKSMGKYVFVFLSSLLSCWMVNGAFVNNGLSIFGPSPVDSLEYLKIGRQTAYLSLNSALKTIYGYFDSIDDLGMPLISRFCYTIGRDTNGYYVVLIILNAIAITLSTFFSNKASRYLTNRETAGIISGIFASTGHFVMFATYGIKENFFILFIILDVYYVLKMSNKSVARCIMGFIFFVLLICLFRLAVAAQIVLAVGAAILLRSRRYRWLGITSVFLITAYVVSNNIDDIIFMLGGGSMENWITYAEYHNTGYTPMFQYFSQFVFSFMGNPPMFNIVDELDFVHFVSFSACIRCFLCPYFIIGLIDAAKEFNYSKTFLLVYWILGTVMLIIVLRGSDFRYSSMYFFPFLIIAMIGFAKRQDFWYSKYLCGFIYFVALFVTWGWNL